MRDVSWLRAVARLMHGEELQIKRNIHTPPDFGSRSDESVSNEHSVPFGAPTLYTPLAFKLAAFAYHTPKLQENNRPIV